MEQKNKYDIVIVGGGHAGVEAAWLAHQFSLRVAIFTIPNVPLASAPCNPAIGGVGKGQVVREIDAMGGLMGRLADLSGIQFRTLNESKGYAVQGTRVQIDKERYSYWAELIINESPIDIVRKKVNKLERKGDLFLLETAEGSYLASRVIITTGTFLNGRMHTGVDISAGGRIDCDSSPGLGKLFSQVKCLDKRFKTGTPPRLQRETIDFSKMAEQASDDEAFNFHWSHEPFERKERQVSCFLTKTNSETLALIRKNKERSPIFNGQINSIGPRYCPSIEDKAYRYEDKDIHHVFVEPEGLELDTFYPNGISTSLPEDVQQGFINTIEGLEDAKIAIKGYAVEYDVVDTTFLDNSLQYIDIPGLYFAGQVCGTSGYEEAAGQGLVAGINAALSFLGQGSLILGRDDSYIGVMVDDLTNNLRDEPYRLFTARSENRLMIRDDNAPHRMANYRIKLDLDLEIDRFLSEYTLEFDKMNLLITSISYLPNKKNKELFKELSLGKLSEKISLSEVLKRSTIDPVAALAAILSKSGIVFSERVIRNVAISIKYEGYIKRAAIELKKLNKLGHKLLGWEKLANDSNLSFECRQRIERIRPSNFGQLQGIEGVRPATVAYVAANYL